jgi:hypothetical protein
MSFIESIFKSLPTGVYFLLTVFVIQSCDPAKILTVNASGNLKTSVTIYANRNVLPRTTGIDSNEKVVIRTPAIEKDGKRKISFYYGFGGWSNKNHMPEFSKNIDSIIIQNSDNELSLTKQEDICNYLVKHRRGIFKNFLVIEAR